MQQEVKIKQETDKIATGPIWKDSKKPLDEIKYKVVLESFAIDRETLARAEERLKDLESTVEDDRFEFIEKEKQYNTTIKEHEQEKSSVEKRLSVKNGELKNIKSNVSQLKQTIASAKMRLSAKNAELKNEKSSVSKLKEEKGSVETRLSATNAELSATNVELKKS